MGRILKQTNHSKIIRELKAGTLFKLVDNDTIYVTMSNNTSTRTKSDYICDITNGILIGSSYYILNSLSAEYDIEILKE